MNSTEMRIIGLSISEKAFEEIPPRHRARVQFDYDLSSGAAQGVTDCMCHSDLPAHAADFEVRQALINDGLAQIRRMPEVWLGHVKIRLAVTPGPIEPDAG